MFLLLLPLLQALQCMVLLQALYLDGNDCLGTRGQQQCCLKAIELQEQ